MANSALTAAKIAEMYKDMAGQKLTEEKAPSTATDIGRKWQETKRRIEQMMVMANPPMVVPPGDWADTLYPGMRIKMPAVYGSPDLEKMVRMRLRSPKDAYFQHWHMHKVNDEKVIVLIVNNNQHTVLEDEWPMFPSDALIAQLRLLEK